MAVILHFANRSFARLVCLIGLTFVCQVSVGQRYPLRPPTSPDQAVEKSNNATAASPNGRYFDRGRHGFTAQVRSSATGSLPIRPLPAIQRTARRSIIVEPTSRLRAESVAPSPLSNGADSHDDNDWPTKPTQDHSRYDNDALVWWKALVLRPLSPTKSQRNVDTNSLVYDTLRRSPRIRAVSQDPLIRELQVIEADSEFDPVSFIRSQFEDRVDPVGDTLSITADGSSFVDDHIWTGTAGIRRKLRNGATYELGQTLGFQNSNSSFFLPQDQGTATLALNVTQPILRGRGKLINQSQILIAQAVGGAAWNTFASELQDEIEATIAAYWQLYFDRSVYLQKQTNVQRGQSVLEKLEGRLGLDSLPSQIARARSSIQARKTDLANAIRDIQNSETELRRLTADRNWAANENVELVPNEAPVAFKAGLDLEQVAVTALQNRPEIKEALTRAKIAGIQKDVSENELLPELSLLLGTYVSALEGESQLGQAIQAQFGEVTPGYSVGIEFELPIRNRAARSRLSQSKLQVAKIRAEVDRTIQNVIAETQVALRRVNSAVETLDAAVLAIDAARQDLEQNLRRWETFALVEGDLAEGQSPTIVLDQLLDSQERLNAAELVYSQAEFELKIAEVGLQRAMGTLLIHENVSFQKSIQRDVPQLELFTQPGNPN